MERTYVHRARMSWKDTPAPRDAVDEVLICVTDDDGRMLDGGFKFYALSGPDPSPCLEIFDDGWWALPGLTDLFVALADLGKDSSPDALCQALEACGFTDKSDEPREVE